MRLRDSHIIDSQIAMRPSALSAGRSLPPGRFLVLNSVRGIVDLMAIVRLEILCQLKNTMASSGTEPVIFRLITIVFQPTTLPRAPISLGVESIYPSPNPVIKVEKLSP
jgi:hypothetical protein